MPAAIAIPALIGAGGQIAGSAIASHGASKAAKAQQAAAGNAASVLQNASTEARLGTSAQRDAAMGTYAPYTALGQQAAGSLSGLMNAGAPAAFQGTTGADVQADPGYQWRMEQGQKALQRSAAARGTLLTGGTAKGLLNYGQGLASQEFANTDARRFRDYTTNAAQQQQQFGNLSNLLNFGYGAQQNQNLLGQQYTSMLNNLGLAGAGYQANGIIDQANVRAGNAVAQGNIWGGTIGNLANNAADWTRLYYANQTPRGPVNSAGPGR
jgi:hypothetical protein